MRPVLKGLALALTLASCSAPLMNPPGRSPSQAASKAPAVTVVMSAPPSPPSRREAPPSLAPTAPASPSPSVFNGWGVIPKPTYTPPVEARCTFDRRDENSQTMFHLLYVLPADAHDRNFDTDGTIAESARAVNRWMGYQALYWQFLFDTYGGDPDITCLTLKQTEAELNAAPDRYVAIRDAVRAASFNRPTKLYVALVELAAQHDAVGLGGSDGVQVYLRSLEVPSRYHGDVRLGTLEHTLAHAMVHALGVVSTGAPHADGHGHLTTPNDLMADPTKAQQGVTAQLDPLHLDYFQHGRTDIGDLTRSCYMNPSLQIPVPLPSSSPLP